MIKASFIKCLFISSLGLNFLYCPSVVYSAPLHSKTLKTIVEHAVSHFPKWFFHDHPREAVHRKPRGTVFDCGLAEFTYSHSMVPTLMSALLKNQIIDPPPSSFTVDPDQPKSILHMWDYISEGSLYNPYTSFKSELGGFAHVSEHALQWLEKMELSAKTPLFKSTFRDIYQRSFKQSSTLFVSTYLYLEKQKLFQSEAQAYLDASTQSSFYGPDYLRERFAKVLPDFHQFDWCSTVPRDLGFWLRREIDGSRLRLWAVVQKVINELDPGFLQYLDHKIEVQLNLKPPVKKTKSPRKSTHQPSSPKQKTPLEIDLTQLYTHWLDDPYPYMFEGDGKQGLKLNQGRLGMFRAGTRGLLYYGGLNPILTQMLKQPKSHFDDNSIWEKVSGLPIENPHMKTKRSAPAFLHVNPKLIEWGIRSLIPDPQSRLHGYTVQQIYQKIFRRYFRLLAKTYQFLHNQRHIKQEVHQYQAMIKGQKDGLVYLKEQYGHVLQQDYIPDDWGIFLQPYHAIGFWLRREIDQTSGLLWEGLQLVLERFDRKWLRNFGSRK